MRGWGVVNSSKAFTWRTGPTSMHGFFSRLRMFLAIAFDGRTNPCNEASAKKRYASAV